MCGEYGPSAEDKGLKPEDMQLKPEAPQKPTPEEVRPPESESRIHQQMSRAREKAGLPPDMNGFQFRGFELTNEGGTIYKAQLNGKELEIERNEHGGYDGSTVNPETGEKEPASMSELVTGFDKAQEASRLSPQQEAYHQKLEAGGKPGEDEVQFNGFKRLDNGVTIFSADIGGVKYRVQDQGMKADGKTRDLLGSRIEQGGSTSLSNTETIELFAKIQEAARTPTTPESGTKKGISA